MPVSEKPAPNLYRASIGSNGADSYQFLCDCVSRNHLDAEIHLDAKSYLETMPSDTLWLQHDIGVGSAVASNYIGRFKGRTHAYKIFLVADTANQAALVRTGDRFTQSFQGQPNLKITRDGHYRFFEWRSPSIFYPSKSDPLHCLPHRVVIKSQQDCYVTKPYNVFRENGSTIIACLPVARIHDFGITTRDLWIIDGKRLHWREETLSTLNPSPKMRILSFMNRAAWLAGADFEPFNIGYKSSTTLNSSPASVTTFLHASNYLA